MDSKEFGLVLAQKLFDLKDLHFGFWEKGAPVTMVFKTPGMVLTAGGRALDSGAIGETVRVRNDNSQLIVDAVVAAAGVVNARTRYAAVDER